MKAIEVIFNAWARLFYCFWYFSVYLEILFINILYLVRDGILALFRVKNPEKYRTKIDLLFDNAYNDYNDVWVIHYRKYMLVPIIIVWLCILRVLDKVAPALASRSLMFFLVFFILVLFDHFALWRHDRFRIYFEKFSKESRAERIRNNTLGLAFFVITAVMAFYH